MKTSLFLLSFLFLPFILPKICLADTSSVFDICPIPDEGYVPDVKTALSIAMAVFEGKYGNNFLKRRKFRAILLDENIWIVEEVRKKIKKKGIERLNPGCKEYKDKEYLAKGVAHYVKIDKKTGKILRICIK